MTTPEARQGDEIARRQALIEQAFAVNGLLYNVAHTALSEELMLTPSEVGNIIMPPRNPGEAYKPRWQLIEGAPATIRARIGEQADETLAFATQLDMRKSESLSAAELAKIDREKVLWQIEGGANRTSIVRRALIEQAMRELYGEDVGQRVVYQFGSQRPIPPVRDDGTPNAEFGVAREIAPDYVQEDEQALTEYGLNVAAARQAGYGIVGDVIEEPAAGIHSVTNVRRVGSPLIRLVELANKENGQLPDLQDGFSAVAQLEGDVAGRQFVIGTNGQYRPKDELHAQKWAETHGVDMLPPVALGDEPGFQTEHNGATLTTAPRQPLAYVNEMVTLQRLA